LIRIGGVTPPGKLDVHAHYLPEPYRQALARAGHGQPDGMPRVPEWSAAEHVDLLDRVGIDAALLSVSSPGVHFGDEAATRDLTRAVNDAGRKAVVDHPGRFGLLASLPLPDVDAALAEIAYCVDELDVDGFVLLTNVAGTYLGDPDWDPLFAELDRRAARVLIHPTSPPCWEQTSLGRPRPMVEFLFDTSRAVVNLVLGGTVARYPGVRIVVPHAGATLPVIADRVSAFSLVLDTDPAADVLRDLASLEFDLAGMPLPRQLDALLALTTIEHLHYGSDFPFTPDFVVEMAAARLDEVEAGDPAGSLMATLRANTERLFPRLA
jgi:predicted TIM-barrel fold metal-dependent hydrolase